MDIVTLVGVGALVLEHITYYIVSRVRKAQSKCSKCSSCQVSAESNKESEEENKSVYERSSERVEKTEKI
jgi:hypothetical protein